MRMPTLLSSVILASCLMLIVLAQLGSSTGIDGGTFSRVLTDDGEVKTGTFRFADIDVHYKSMEPAQADRPVVLFLHGAKFTSENWAHIGTLAKVRDLGYKAVAVDLPGHGKTTGLPYSDNNMRAEFVRDAFNFSTEGVNLSRRGGVLVTPSMSGTYAIPYLDRYGRDLKGWLALAPIGVRKWGGPWEDTHKAVDMLAMYGENDPLLPDADVLLKLFEHSRKVVVPGAGHPCYLEQPEAFHKELGTFLTRVFSGTI